MNEITLIAITVHKTLAMIFFFSYKFSVLSKLYNESNTSMIFLLLFNTRMLEYVSSKAWSGFNRVCLTMCEYASE